MLEDKVGMVRLFIDKADERMKEWEKLSLAGYVGFA